MKNIYYTALSFILFGGLTFGQSTTVLNQNNVSANIQDEGFFFNNTTNSLAGYEVPTGGGNHTIYSSSFWVGGQDINGQLKLCAQKYFGSGQDYWPGFLSLGQANQIVNPFGQSIWQVTKAQIDNHILNFQSPGYITPNDISNWPAQGDTALGMLPYVAPFVDVNNDGNYNSSDGDYPCIKGDEAVYIVTHDKGNVHGSGGDMIGIELHYLIYQFSTVPELQDVTFIDLEMVNMGTQTIYDFRGSYFLDADVGNSADDFVGCDTTRNLVFAYNGDAFDESSMGGPGYGIPPAVGVVCLSHPISSTSVFSNGAPPQQADPGNAIEYFNVMNGNYIDGSDHLNDLGNPTDFMFYGDPNDLMAWSEVSSGNIPGDRRMVMSTDLGTLTPNFGPGIYGTRNMSYAVMQSQGTSNLNSVTELYQLTDFVQNFYDGMSSNCFDEATASLNTLEFFDFTMYPNPTKGAITLSLPLTGDEVLIQILDVSGRIVYSGEFHNTNEVQIDLNESSGVYIVKTEINSHSSMKRLILH